MKLFIPLYARKKYQGEYTTKIPKKLPFSIVAIKIKDGQPVIARYDVLKYKAVVHTDFDFVTSTQKGLPAHFE